MTYKSIFPKNYLYLIILIEDIFNFKSFIF
jgi:hypothetical protein